VNPPSVSGRLTALTLWLDVVLSARARLVVLVAGFLLFVALFFPLWEITMFAQMFPEGIRMSIFAHKLVGGNNGADLQGINILNHYIGMREIRAQDFPEMKFIPFALGLFLLLGLRTAVFGRIHQLVDLLVLFTYFGLFSLAAFYYRMHTFGHQLSPEAPIKVAPFTPPVFGHQHIANFDVYSYPGPGTYLLGAYALILAGVMLLEIRRDGRRNTIQTPRMAA
jgi:copper chaperone NosL